MRERESDVSILNQNFHGASMAHGNFLLVSSNPKSHINPTLHFASRLLSMGAKVTLLLGNSAARSISKDQLPEGLCLSTFSDGYHDGMKFSDIERWLSEFDRRGRHALTELLLSSANQGRPFTCVVHTILIPWVIEAARQLHVPTAVLWIQSATVLSVFYYYFNGFGDEIRNNKDNPSFCIQFPGLPLLDISDLPSFMVSDTHGFILKEFEHKIQALEKETNIPVLINTFDAMEHDAMRAIGKFNLIPIGPFVSFAGSEASTQKEYIKWLDSKPDSSVVYVAFGSISTLTKKQMEEIAGGLLECGYPFLWVVRLDAIGEELSCLEKLEAQGKTVPWCSQVEVLSHRSVGCFLTHCGWNSTVESLAAGVPTVACPQWADQTTNAKMMEDVWEIGVRVKSDIDEGVTEGKEIARCLRVVMDGGERGKQLRINAGRWRRLAKEAASGSSDRNLKVFVEEACQGK